MNKLDRTQQMRRRGFLTLVVEEKAFMCKECGDEVYTCNGCHDYFDKGDIVYCDENNSKHYCESCGELGGPTLKPKPPKGYGVGERP